MTGLAKFRFGLLAATTLTLAVGVPSADAATRVAKSTHKEHNFNDGKLSPFTEDQGYGQNQLKNEGITFTDDGHRGKRIKISWKESEYDGTRRERGHEWKGNVTTNSQLFSGFILRIPKDKNSGVRFPDNKDTIIWQLYCWDSDGCDNWTAHLSIKNNKLVMSYRQACVTEQETTVVRDLDRDTDMAIQIRTKPGRGDAEIDVLIDGVNRMDKNDANIGFGSFLRNGNLKTSVIGVKMGMYCADTANYTNNEVRNLYYDNFGVIANGRFQTGMNNIDPKY